MMRLALLLLLAPAVSAKTATATFDMDGVSGTVAFDQSDADATTTIDVDLAGLEDLPNKWHVHVFPVGQGCSASSTGGHFNPYDSDNSGCSEDTPEACEVGDLSGQFGKFNASSVAETYESDIITLYGNDSIVGRSIVVHANSDGSRYACATIELDVDVITVVTYFDKPVAGTVTMQQDASDPSADTSIMVDLWWTADPSLVTENHKWHVHENRIPIDGTCSDAGGHWNPLDVSNDDCVLGGDDSDCEIGDLTMKDGWLNLPATGADKGFWTDTNLPLSGDYSVAGLSMVIHAQDAGADRVACGNNAKTAVATFDGSQGVSGTVVFYQGGPDAETTIDVDLAGLADTPNKWHVHVFPVDADTGDCSSFSTGGHFNPYGVNPDNCADLTTEAAKEAGCEVGDLSGKWGTFDAATAAGSYSDANVTLYGQDSVVGRSVVIHDSSGARYACADIALDQATTTVVSTIAGPLTGTVSMTQASADPLGDTFIVVDVDYADSSTAATTGHNWHIHEDQLADASTCATGDAGAHYNPYEVSNDGCYESGADSACGVGELAWSQGQLDLPATGADKYFFSDSNLPLTGDFGVADRSVVIHAADSGSAYLACGNNAFTGKRAVAAFDFGGVEGTVTFTQPTLTEPTTIDVALSGLEDTPNKWHVHVFPVGQGCSADATGGHFNPFDSDNSGCSTDTPDECEVGDLSGKFGTLDAAAVTASYTDDTLDLWGPNSVVGRSIVLHANSDGSRYACATIEPDFDVVTVVTYFNDPVAGTVTMKQDASDPSADTSILVDLWWGADPSTVTENHKWHVHEDRVPIGGSCADASGHYNPLDVSNDYCAEGNDDSECEIADLTMKDGWLNLPATGADKGFWTDTNLPLSGDYSVAGRSMVIHAADAGADRVACGNNAKTAVATFDGSQGPSGTVVFYQAGPDAETTIDVVLDGLSGLSNKWHVHLFPVGADDGDCSADSTGGHYNPFNVNAANCADLTTEAAREAGCEVGDLSGKWGTFDEADVDFSVSDANLTLHGLYSVVGRSVVIHDDTGARYACADIALWEDTTEVVATLAGSLAGSVTFTQSASDPLGDTTILVDVAYSDDDAAATSYHNWHVHEDQLSDAATCATGDAGGHYNPYEVSDGDCYITGDPWRCGLGELSYKHGWLDIPDKVLFTDGLLPLTGDFGIDDRSLVIHAADQGSAYEGCANNVLVSSAADDDDDDESGGDGDDDSELSAMTTGIIVAASVCAVGVALAIYYYYKTAEDEQPLTPGGGKRGMEMAGTSSSSGGAGAVSAAGQV